MRALISTIIAVSLTLHAVLGCCWHHSCAWNSATIEVAAKPCKTTTCCRCKARCESQSVANAESRKVPQPPASPCDESCTQKGNFLATGRTQADCEATQITLAVSMPAVSIVQPKLSSNTTPKFDVIDVSPPPVRLHLRLQLLLI